MIETERIRSRFAPVAASSTFRRIRTRFNLSGKKVFDIGCAFGEHLVLFGKGSVGLTNSSEEAAFSKEMSTTVLVGNAERLDALELPRPFDAIWANNLFEHLLSPHSFLINLKTIAKSDTLLILGVPVIPKVSSLVSLRRFRGALAVAHINFFTRETLVLTAERAGWRVREVRPFLISLAWLDTLLGFFAPHLYVIAENDSSFRYPDKKSLEWSADDSMYARLFSATQESSEKI